VQGRGMILLDKKKREITFGINPPDEKRESDPKPIPGWLIIIRVENNE
jgi:hypothetical protein